LVNNESLAFFHHKVDNKAMKVVEKDRVISGMLQDELNRCLEMLDSIEKALSKLPKGVLSSRKKQYKKKVYSYYYLKYRDGEKVVNKHISNEKVQMLVEKLEKRKKYIKELKSYEKKVAYLQKVLKTGRKQIRGNKSQK
jgi:Mg2+ and Co2+ transporter CorA